MSRRCLVLCRGPGGPDVGSARGRGVIDLTATSTKLVKVISTNRKLNSFDRGRGHSRSKGRNQRGVALSARERS